MLLRGLRQVNPREARHVALDFHQRQPFPLRDMRVTGPLQKAPWRYVIMQLGDKVSVRESAINLVARYHNEGINDVAHLLFDPHSTDVSHLSGDEFLEFDERTKFIVALEGGEHGASATVPTSEFASMIHELVSHRDIIWHKEIRELRIISCNFDCRPSEMRDNNPLYSEELFQTLRTRYGLRTQRLTAFNRWVRVNVHGYLLTADRSNGPWRVKDRNAKNTWILGSDSVQRLQRAEPNVIVADARLQDDQQMPPTLPLGDDHAHQEHSDNVEDTDLGNPHFESEEAVHEPVSVRSLWTQLDSIVTPRQRQIVLLAEAASKGSALIAIFTDMFQHVTRGQAHLVPLLSSVRESAAQSEKITLDVYDVNTRLVTSHTLDFSSRESLTAITELNQMWQHGKFMIRRRMGSGSGIAREQSPDGLLDVEFPSTLAAGLLARSILNIQRIAARDQMRDSVMTDQLNTALEVHAYLNVMQMSYDSVVRTGMIITKLVQKALSSETSMLAEVASVTSRAVGKSAMVLPGIDVVVFLLNIGLDVYELCAAVTQAQRIRFAVQLNVDAAFFGVFIGAVSTGSIGLAAFMVPLAGLTFGFTALVDVLTEATGQGLEVAQYFLQYFEDYTTPCFWEPSIYSGQQSVNLAYTAPKIDDTSHLSTAVISKVDCTRDDRIILTFGSQHLFKTVRWHAGNNWIPNRMAYSASHEHSYKGGFHDDDHIINLREALEVNPTYVFVFPESDTRAITLPMVPVSNIDYGYGNCPFIYVQHSPGMTVIRKLQKNAPFWFEFYGNDEECIRVLKMNYFLTTINIALADFERTLVTPAEIPSVWHDKLHYNITCTHNSHHRLRITLGASYTVTNISPSGAPISIWTLVLTGKMVNRFERHHEDDSMNVIRINDITITFVGRFAQLLIIAEEVVGEINLDNGNDNSLTLTSATSRYLQNHKKPRLVMPVSGYIAIRNSDPPQWMDVKDGNTRIRVPKWLSVLHPDISLVGRRQETGEVFYFAPRHSTSNDGGDDDNYGGALYLQVKNRGEETRKLHFCCPDAYVRGASFAQNVVFVQLSNSLTLAMPANYATPIVIKIAIDVIPSDDNNRIGSMRQFIEDIRKSYDIGLSVEVKHLDGPGVRIWYIPANDEFLHITHPKARNMHFVSSVKSGVSAANYVYFLFEPTNRELYVQTGSATLPTSTVAPPTLRKLDIPALRNVISDGIRGYVHTSDGRTYQLHARNTLRLTEIDANTFDKTELIPLQSLCGATLNEIITPTTSSTTTTPGLMDAESVVFGEPEGMVRLWNVTVDNRPVSAWCDTVQDTVVIVGDDDSLPDNAGIDNAVMYVGFVAGRAIALHKPTHALYTRQLLGATQLYSLMYDGDRNQWNIIKTAVTNDTSGAMREDGASAGWKMLSIHGVLVESATVQGDTLVVTSTDGLIFVLSFPDTESHTTRTIATSSSPSTVTPPPVIALHGVTDVWLTQQKKLYPSEHLSEALQSIATRTTYHTTRYLVVGTTSIPPHLFDVSHNALVPFPPKDDHTAVFLAMMDTPVGYPVHALYFSVKRKMLVMTKNIGENVGIPIGGTSAEAVYVNDDDTLVVHPSANKPFTPAVKLPFANIIVLGAGAGPSSSNVYDNYFLAHARNSSDPLSGDLYSRDPNSDLYRIFPRGACSAESNCTSINTIGECDTAAWALFGQVLHGPARPVNNNRTTTITNCGFAPGFTWAVNGCAASGSDATFDLFHGCLCRCSVPQKAEDVSPVTRKRCLHPNVAGYDFSRSEPDGLTTFHATNIRCAVGYELEDPLTGIVITPCATNGIPYSVRGCTLTPSHSMADAFTLRASMYASDDWDCSNTTVGTEALVRWPHVNECRRDESTNIYMKLTCLAPNILSLGTYGNKRCSRSQQLTRHHIARKECVPAEWTLGVKSRVNTAFATGIPYTIWNWHGFCDESANIKRDGFCRGHLATFTYGSRSKCADECKQYPGCHAYVYRFGLYFCAFYQVAESVGRLCREIGYPCHVKIYKPSARGFQTLRFGSHEYQDEQITRIDVPPGCEASIQTRSGHNTVWQVSGDSSSSEWKEWQRITRDDPVAQIIVRALYTCNNERCHSPCKTSWSWPNTKWCHTQAENPHSRWGFCHCVSNTNDNNGANSDDFSNRSLRARHFEEKCVFPFVYRGTSYTGCVNLRDNNQPWCATAVDPKTNKMTTFGYCDERHPKLIACAGAGSAASGGYQCTFPFRVRGRMFHSCTSFGDDDTRRRKWCSLKVDDARNHVGPVGNYGYCPESCSSSVHVNTCMQQFPDLLTRWEPLEPSRIQFGNSDWGLMTDNVCEHTGGVQYETKTCRILKIETGEVTAPCSFGCRDGACTSDSIDGAGGCPGYHVASQCLEYGRRDSDCCAGSTATCAGGYMWTLGLRGCGSESQARRGVHGSCCTPPACKCSGKTDVSGRGGSDCRSLFTQQRWCYVDKNSSCEDEQGRGFSYEACRDTAASSTDRVTVESGTSVPFVSPLQLATRLIRRRGSRGRRR
eukprot:GEMP01000093.1.p1 GENE.GEMP01000093.1~~GEMP01000093.1.p1  ORF type:complete len:2576 (+),score=317.10 GEMP01000093.1:234-7730(+)